MKDIKTLIDIVAKLKRILTTKQKKKFTLLFFVIFIGSILELLGISSVIPFIQVLIAPDNITEKWYGKIIVNLFSVHNEMELIIIIGIFIMGIYIIKNLYLLLDNYIQISFRFGIMKELSVSLLTSYLRRPYTYFLNINSAEILRGITDDVYGVFCIIENMTRFLTDFITAVIIGIFIIVTDPFLAIGVLILSAVCFISISVGFKSKMNQMGEILRDAAKLKNQYAYQAIIGVKEIFVLQRRENFIKKYDEAYEGTRKAEINKNFAVACPDKIIEAVCVSGIITLICVQVGYGQDMASAVPQLAAFVVAAFKILPSISRMIGNINSIVYYRSSLESTYKNVVESQQYKEKEEKYIAENTNKVDNGKKKFVDAVKIKSVYWKYQESQEYVLDDLSMIIRKGEAIGLIGSSGSGKTTLADIILGLLQPKSGRVLVDDTDIFAIPLIWSRMIGYVPQSVFLLDDSIRNNIIFGIEDEKINDSNIWRAIEQAQLKTFVERLPNGLDTIVGERGIKFSGGQRQRIAIARALYFNPDILVMDEATAALDNETEKAVMESINALQGQKTLIIIAHRLTTVKNCDKIYEIKDGKAVLCDFKKVFKS